MHGGVYYRRVDDKIQSVGSVGLSYYPYSNVGHFPGARGAVSRKELLHIVMLLLLYWQFIYAGP